MQIASHNPFSVLSNKRIRPEGPKPKDTRPTQRKEAPPKKEKGEVKNEAPKKESKNVALTDATKQEDLQKQLAKEQEKLDKEAKRERDKTDKHDRSGKGHQVRKEGKGVGGWDDNKVEIEVVPEVVAEAADDEEKEQVENKTEKKEGKSEAAEISRAAAAEEAARQREAEEKEMTLEEWREKQKEMAPPTAAFKIRTVDTSAFQGMVAKGKEKGDKKFQIGGEKPKKPAPKKEEKKKEEKEKVQLDIGFRMENPARQGKGKGEGGKGKGGGKGRGGYQSKEQEKQEPSAPQVDDPRAFPALGAQKATEAATAEASA